MLSRQIAVFQRTLNTRSLTYVATKNVPITVARGDGIGPEITDSTMRVLHAAGASIVPEYIDIGEKIFLSGNTSGIEKKSWDSIRRNRVLLKGPITTPPGSGYKSINVSIRKTMGLYANVRPCSSYHPFISTRFPNMDVVIIRENEEDLYAGIEHRQTQDVYQCLKLITRPGCERICRYAFEYARINGRKKVTCFVKHNIMKLTDGLFNKIFKEVAAQYPEIQSETIIVDIGAARLADSPTRFDVCVMPNLYGDILSDIAAQITGSVGLGGSANIGDGYAMFEAIHGSAPDIAGQNIANPSGMLLSAVEMMVHIGQPDVASVVHNAWLRTIEDGIHPPDIFSELSKKKVGTQEFTHAVIENLGKDPKVLRKAQYSAADAKSTISGLSPVKERKPQKKDLVGIDVFLDWAGGDADKLGEAVSKLSGDGLKLTLITNRGVKVWPEGYPETFTVDHWRCRFKATAADGFVNPAQLLSVLLRIHNAGFQVIKTENLYNFDGEPGFALGQGE